MTKHPIEVITSVERRRRWSRKVRERLVAACFEPDAVISEISRAAGIHVSQLFRWLKELCQIEQLRSETATLVPAIVSDVALATSGDVSATDGCSLCFGVMESHQASIASIGCIGRRVFSFENGRLGDVPWAHVRRSWWRRRHLPY